MICTRCKQERGDNFPKSATKRFEKATKEYQKFHTWCRGCHSEAQRERNLETRQFLYSFKKRACMDCGRSYHPALMDFDHRPGTVKLFSIGAAGGWTKSREVLEAEIAKCDVVCVICHRVRTWNRKYPENPISNEDIVRPAQ